MKYLLLTVGLFAFSSCLSSDPVMTTGAYDEQFALQISRGRNIVKPLVRRGSGVAVAVGVNGNLVWSEGFGYDSLQHARPVQPDTQFRVYSLMKQITTVLALQLSIRGDVNLSDPVRLIMPELPLHYADVTLLQLLTHNAGVRHYHSLAEAAMKQHCETASDGLPLFINDALVSIPGTGESYSSFGFVLASAVLEKAGGQKFPELLQERILSPAGMTDTVLENSRPGTQVVTFYDVDEAGKRSESPSLDNSCKMGAGGFIASAEDIVSFHNAVMRGELVPMPAVRQMLGTRTALEAGGSGPGGEAVSIADLESGISVVVLSNTSGLEQQIALNRVRDLLHALFQSDL